MTEYFVSERLLLADQSKWEKAIKMVLTTFDDAVKWTKNASHKNSKQYHFYFFSFTFSWSDTFYEPSTLHTV